MLRNHKYDVVVPVNTISQQVVRESEVLGHSQPQSDFESSLNYKRSYFFFFLKNSLFNTCFWHCWVLMGHCHEV